MFLPASAVAGQQVFEVVVVLLLLLLLIKLQKQEKHCINCQKQLIFHRAAIFCILLICFSCLVYLCFLCFSLFFGRSSHKQSEAANISQSSNNLYSFDLFLVFGIPLFALFWSSCSFLSCSRGSSCFLKLARYRFFIIILIDFIFIFDVINYLNTMNLPNLLHQILCNFTKFAISCNF